MTSKLKLGNASAKTDNKTHGGHPYVATLTKKSFPECPDRKHCDPYFFDNSFLSSEIDDPLDEK